MTNKMAKCMNREMNDKADFLGHKTDAMTYIVSSYFANETTDTIDKAIKSLREMRKIIVKLNK